MNIAFVVPEYITETKGGGLATYINNIAYIFSKRGHIVTIIVLADKTESILFAPNIYLERVYVDISKVNMDVPGSIIRECSKKLNEKLLCIDREVRKIDVVQYANWKALAFYRTNLPTVVRISSDWPYWRAANSLNYDVNLEYQCVKTIDYMEELALMNADYVFCPSVLFANIISKRVGTKIEVIESPFIEKLIEKDNKVYENNLVGKKYILTYGNLNLLKGTKLLGDSIYNILKKNSDMLYVLAGNDAGWSDDKEAHVSAVEYVKSKAKEYANRVIYVGALSRNELYPIIYGAFCCIFPSRVDNLPNACIEAMAMGKLVIGTQGASFEQLITDNMNGFLIERENVDSLCEAVDKVIKLSGDDRYSIEKAARTRVDAIDSEAIADAVERIYRKVISGYKQKVDREYYCAIREKYISEIGFADDEKMLLAE